MVWAHPVCLLAERAGCADPRAAGETQGHMGSGFPSKQLVKQTQLGQTHTHTWGLKHTQYT